MRNRKQEKIIQFILVIATIVMTILRFLMNEKGRVNPDSIRFMRQANVFPEIDNTTTPLFYSLSIKLFTIFTDEFWSSKIVGILCYIFLIHFAWKKKFYYKEIILVGGLFMYVSIFSFTMSEALILPFIFVLLYLGKQVIIGELKGAKAIFWLSLLLILAFNVRYSGLFFMGALFLYGVLNLKKSFGKLFIISGVIGFFFVVLYKLLFIDTFNETYTQDFLDMGLKSTQQLLVEGFQGLATSFNPFIHIADPSGGTINIGIFGIGALNILLLLFLCLKNKLSSTEFFFVFIAIIGIGCSFFVQYFYSVNALDYRLLSPFILPIWLVYFKKVYAVFGKLTYGITVLSFITGFIFTSLSSANYLENRKIVKKFLISENLMKEKIIYYLPGYEGDDNLRRIQVAEIISTVNPRVYITHEPKDTLKKASLTEHRVVSKIKIKQNKFQ